MSSTVANNPAPCPAREAPARRGTPRRSASRAVLAIVALLALVSCTGGQRTPTSYGDPGSSVEREFVAGCVDPDQQPDGLSTPKKVCQCSYDAIKKTIPFDDFKKYNEQLSEEPGPLPEALQSILDACAEAG